MVPWPSGKAKVCKTFIPQFKSGWHLQIESCILISSSGCSFYLWLMLYAVSAFLWRLAVKKRAIAGRGKEIMGGVNGSLVYRSYRAESPLQRSASGALSSDRAVS